MSNSLQTELEFAVVGADEAKQYFSRLTKADLAHGYLFTGPHGVGKKTFARRLAQSLLCEAHKEHVLGYDGTCAACKLVEKKRHPDVIEVVGGIKIGEQYERAAFGTSEITSRDLVHQLSLQSYAGSYRIFIFGDADFASHEAANALLKFFEEPPPSVILLVTSATPGRLLPTIRSRLCEVHFNPLSRGQIEQILIAEDVAPKEAQQAARVGQGSVSRARATLKADEESLRDQVIEWFFEVVRGGSPEAAWASRETLDEALETMKTLVRDWCALTVAGQSAPMLAADLSASISRLPPLDHADALRMLTRLTDAQKIARTNVSPAIVVEMVRMHLSGSASTGGRTPRRRTAAP
ncbi:MAG: AAA family ATPase [Candidatus Eremiobacteraeota bacterium]|nr:AAA family ATPase [Candidatus Eremiobacteraeota bacterium]